MDKKEIIINNVNVAECEFLRKCVIPDNEGCAVDDSLCCDVGNCYYKQLQKSKEENKKLKQYLLNIGMIIEEIEQQYDDIKDFTEIKEIKEILKEAL